MASGAQYAAVIEKAGSEATESLRVLMQTLEDRKATGGTSIVVRSYILELLRGFSGDGNFFSTAAVVVGALPEKDEAVGIDQVRLVAAVRALVSKIKDATSAYVDDDLILLSESMITKVPPMVARLTQQMGSRTAPE